MGISSSKKKTLTVIAGVALLLYGVAGFLVAPSILQPKLVDELSRQTGCPVEIGDVDVNPFALSLTIEDFALLDHERQPILRFKELYINFETISLFHGAYTFSEVHLSMPRMFVAVRPDGSNNLADIRRPPEEEPKEAEALPMRVIIGALGIDSGKVFFDDRARPVPYHAVFDSLNLSLEDFTTLPNEAGEYVFEASTGRGELIQWRGNVSVVPMRSAGSFDLRNIRMRRFWEYMQDRLNFEASTGSADFHAEYLFDLSRDTLVFELRKGTLQAKDVEMTSTVDTVKGVALPSLFVGGIRVNYTGKEIEIDSIRTDNLALANALSADGRITLKDMFLLKDETPDTSTVRKPLGWNILLRHITCMSTSFRNEDRTTVPPALLSIESADLTVDSLRLDRPLPASIRAEGTINGDGTFVTRGSLTIDVERLSVEAQQKAELTGLSLVPFQPYVNAYAKAELKSGEIEYNGAVHFFQQGSTRTIDYDGNFVCTDLRVTDTVLQEDFFRLGRMEMKNLSFQQSSRSFSIGEISVRKPYLRVIIGPDRVTNLQNMMVRDTLAADTTAAASNSDADTLPPPAPMKSRIGKIRVADGSFNFSDLSLRPNFAVGVHEMNGTIGTLSSDSLSRAEVDLSGKVDKYAPAMIKGQINPLSEEAFTDITMSFHGIELTTFTPYSARFAGYKIDKGKLNVDLHYRLNKSILEGENRFVLDQLTLGESVESPDATSLPVKLAIALLKDSHGVIDLDIPVSGDLNDPDFSVMPIVMQAAVNLVVKAVTAPFKLLGSMFGGGDEELNYVEFTSGSDSLMMREREKLANLAKGLKERPGLALEIKGIAVDSLDRRALAVAAVQSRIQPRVRPGASIADYTPQQRASVQLIYTEVFKDDPKKLLPPAAGEKGAGAREENDLDVTKAAFEKLVGAQTVAGESLRSLAGRRADEVKSFLVLENGIGQERVFLTDVNAAAAARDGLVQMELVLQAK